MIEVANNVIVFSYKREDLFNDVSLLSAYMVKNMVIKEGSALDEYSITEDEKDVWGVCLKQALPDIYEAFLKISSGVVDAFFEEPVSNNSIISITIDDNKAYNNNVLRLVESTLRDCINYGTLVEFYSVCLNDALYNVAKGKYASCMYQLNKRLFQLKRKKVSIC